MAHWIKALEAKPNQSSIFGTHIVERTNFCKLSSDGHTLGEWGIFFNAKMLQTFL